MAPPRTAAVVGSGCAGLAAAHALASRGVRVTLFEAASSIGGHADTRQVEGVDVDVGFMVFNRVTYPNMLAWFDELGVESELSDMSFSVSRRDGVNCEWGSNGLGALFAQRRNAASPAFARMLYELTCFEKDVLSYLAALEAAERAPAANGAANGNGHAAAPASACESGGETLGAFLAARRYSAYFTENYVVPICSSIWSTPGDAILSCDAATVCAFLRNHHMLQLTGRPAWLTVKGRSRRYTEAVAARIKAAGGVIRTGTRVAGVTHAAPGGGDGAAVRLEDGSEEGFDAVVLAAHAPDSLALLGGGATGAERDVLSAFSYQESDIYLHRDASLMPAARAAWSAWNFLSGSGGAVCLTYWLNTLQNLGDVPFAAGGAGPPPPVLVTLNPSTPPAHVVARWRAAHPVPTRAAAAAKRALPWIQGAGNGGVFFCGAYAGFGFHEDGVKAGFAAAAAALGSDWAPRPDARPLSLSLSERAARASCHSFLASFVRHGCMTLAEPGAEPRRIGPPAACAAAAAADAAAPAFGAGGGAADAEARYAAAEADPDALHVTLRIARPAFYWKLATRADLGLADAYVDGDIEVQPSLMALLCLCIANRDAAAAQEHRDATSAAAAAAAAASSASALSAVAGAARAQLRRYGGMATAAVGLTGAYWRHLRRNNSVAQARRNIAAHYDLSNDMFRLFLSADMTYSCAIFERPGEALQCAQERKLRALATKARVSPGQRVLEIGFGWGSLSLLLAKHFGARVTGITLSEQQLSLATQRVKDAGLEHLIDFHLVDYRVHQPANGVAYDRIVSCEMLEAVGHEYMPDYFRHCGRLLAPGGVLVVQVITTPEGRYDAYRRSTDFIKEYIFPGCCCPSLAAVLAAAGAGGGFTLAASEEIGTHYAPTLLRWREAFMANAGPLKALGFNDAFIRCWDYYFQYCAAGFATRTLGDVQLVLTQPGNTAALGNVPFRAEPAGQQPKLWW